ncbi:hypothetical protein GCM10023083_64190 [Streptomyces phyllanthi]
MWHMRLRRVRGRWVAAARGSGRGPEGARGCVDVRLRRDGGPPCSSEAEKLGGATGHGRPAPIPRHHGAVTDGVGRAPPPEAATPPPGASTDSGRPPVPAARYLRAPRDREGEP